MSNEITWSATGKNPDSIRLYKPAVITGVVRDADTDKPITHFQVRPGVYWTEGDAFEESTFDCFVDVAAADGHFDAAVQRIGLGSSEHTPTFAAMVIAPGYAPQVTPKVQLGKAYEPFVIRLHKAGATAGTVTDPTGKAAEGATVYYVTPTDTARVEGLSLSENVAHAPSLRTKTDASGAFQLPAAVEGVRLLVLHPAGYAFVPAATTKITLTPWARVQGDIINVGHPENGVPMTLQTTLQAAKPNALSDIAFELKTSTRADGKFVFDYVPARRLELLADTDKATSNSTNVEPKPGEAVELHLGK